MNIILATVLLTLLGASLVVLIVWLSVVSWKSIKFKKKVKIQLDEIRKKMYDDDQSLSTSIGQLYTYIDGEVNNNWNKIEEYKKSVGYEFEELHKGILTEISSNLREIKKDHKTLEKTIDSRFDKVHNLIKEKE